jgi:hypothetical protein
MEPLAAGGYHVFAPDVRGYAGWCALARPDVFRSVAMMSAPFGGTPALPFDTANTPRIASTPVNPDAIYDDLAKLTPPCKHYARYYQTAEANDDLWHPPQGLLAFLRAYYVRVAADASRSARMELLVGTRSSRRHRRSVRTM